MCYHDTKYCPRCNQPFECKAGNITQCHCFGINLTAEQKAYLEEKYHDCLCDKCLQDLQEEWERFKEKYIFG